MVTIDGDEITGATIDGQDVQEITIDGQVAWTAVTVYDDFEHNNLSGNYVGDTANIETVNENNTPTTARNGSYMVGITGGDASNTAFLDSMSENDQPSSGESFSFWFYLDEKDNRRFLFGSQTTQDRLGDYTGYAIWLRTEGDTSELEYWSNGSSSWSTDNPESVVMDENTWYRVDVFWNDGSGPFSSTELGMRILETNGSTHQSVSTNDSNEVSGGRLGFYSPSSGSSMCYIDYITSNTDPI